MKTPKTQVKGDGSYTPPTKLEINFLGASETDSIFISRIKYQGGEYEVRTGFYRGLGHNGIFQHLKDIESVLNRLL